MEKRIGERNSRDEHDQSILHTCMKTSQLNYFIINIHKNAQKSSVLEYA
jgi:hypothetical protein